MNILSFGAGAVGLGVNSCLIKAGQTLDIVARPKTAQELKEKGLIRSGIFGDFKVQAKELTVYDSLEKLPEKVYDYILVSTKSYDSKSSADELAQHKRLIGKNTKIILFQNGWGNAEIFAEHFPKEQIFNARVITGFTRPNPNEVVITVHADDIKIGSLFNPDANELKELCDWITAGDIPAMVVEDIARDMWAKMIYNCALNPLGAILGVSYGTLGDNQETRVIMNNIIEEIFAVMKAEGYQTHWDNTADYSKVFYEKLIPATANHKSSTLQSLKAKRRIELDALTGIVIQLAKKHNIAVHANETLYQMLKFMEKD